ncbi:hypothetical protein SARC_07971 [Sphaeroforma arctica JP610]|uniref:CBM1 domain-containing protein n=1 Tax=Sphaeroforma arctica JP610 TaxID=667725 RepID=A0A0L0FSB8_9EUKA|nr:hypothetical protein SARC_07971 [Sphaeroforma arctica JP610]KNC79635.1 hypothetical protein SARC_07971 [Sphaeroforma arctica JP610]|eukprot:XP_014153537.1 hypothetical protein SARC_07971 [Sphaeroforma arctica JP610]
MTFSKLTLALVAYVVILSINVSAADVGDKNRILVASDEELSSNNILLDVPFDVLRSVENEMEELAAMMRQWNDGGSNDNARTCSLEGSACGYPFQDPCCVGLACLRRGFYSECIPESNPGNPEGADTIILAAQADLEDSSDAIAVVNGVPGQNNEVVSTGRLNFHARAQKRRRRERDAGVHSAPNVKRDIRTITTEESLENKKVHVSQQRVVMKQD